jgi:hypothetical protein
VVGERLVRVGGADRLMGRVEPAGIVALCLYELAALTTRRVPPLTHIFRGHPWTFHLFVGWLFWHTWRDVR